MTTFARTPESSTSTTHEPTIRLVRYDIYLFAYSTTIIHIKAG